MAKAIGDRQRIALGPIQKGREIQSVVWVLPGAQMLGGPATPRANARVSRSKLNLTP
jgi:hypothetical protein